MQRGLSVLQSRYRLRHALLQEQTYNLHYVTSKWLQKNARGPGAVARRPIWLRANQFTASRRRNYFVSTFAACGATVPPAFRLRPIPTRCCALLVTIRVQQLIYSTTATFCRSLTQSVVCIWHSLTATGSYIFLNIIIFIYCNHDTLIWPSCISSALRIYNKKNTRYMMNIL